MRRLYLLLSIVVLMLVGCTDDIPNKVHLDEIQFQQKPQVYEPTSYQLATLFSNANQKVLVEIKTPITYMVPQWYDCSFNSPSEVKNAEYKLNIYKERAESEDEDSLPENICTYSWYYIAKDNIRDFQNNVIKYTGTLSTNAVSANQLYVSQFENYPDLKLYGELNPVTAIKQTVSCNIAKYCDLEDFTLPISWYYFQIENGDFVVLRVKLESAEAGHLYDINSYFEDFLLQDKKIDLKQIKQDYDHALALAENIDQEASFILDYILVGDYQTRYETRETRADKSDSSSTTISATKITWDSVESEKINSPTTTTDSKSDVVISNETDITKHSNHDDKIKIDASSFIEQYLEEEEGLYDYITDPVVDYFED